MLAARLGTSPQGRIALAPMSAEPAPLLVVEDNPVDAEILPASA